MRKPKTKRPVITKKNASKKGYKNSPGRIDRCRRALLAIENKEVTIRKASDIYDLSYGYLQRRLSGEVEIESRNGQSPVFNKTEEEALAHWLHEMACRGMGLKPAELFDHVQQIVTKENRNTPFINNRPGYDWYYGFLKRNSHIIQIRSETPLETCRARVTKRITDVWYSCFREFLISKGLIDKPNCIWNADETGFSMGSVSGKVIGPSRTHHSSQVPHLSGGPSKQRLTVMFCGSAAGTMMPPYHVYPEPKPRGYNPLTGALHGSDIAYTKKGWMDSTTFEKFLDFFHLHAGEERPVLLLIDSVSSHISMSAFELASKRGIELYRIVPNATHLMQPLDVGVFGPLKQRWHQVVRAHTRHNPGSPIGKSNFPEKLKEAYLLFYKPLTVINAFRSSGIYPVDGNVITTEQVKPGVTFISNNSEELTCSVTTENSTNVNIPNSVIPQPCGSSLALQALESVLTTPTKIKYKKRLQEGYDVPGHSPCFDAYKKLVSESLKHKINENVAVVSDCEDVDTSSDVQSIHCEQNVNQSGLDILATAAFTCSKENTEVCESGISPTMKEALTFPSAPEKKKKENSQRIELPDHLTSPESMRTMALRNLITIRAFRDREVKAKKKYMSQVLKKTMKSKANVAKQKGQYFGKSKCKSSGKLQQENPIKSSTEENVSCILCHGTWDKDKNMDVERVWVQCDICDNWSHASCNVSPVVDDDDFYCDKCQE